jgi:threonine synthase
MSLWRWAEWFDAAPESARISLGEGDTPLVHSRRIGPSCGLKHLYFKLETTNPTASYKDRFAVGAVSHMVAAGQTRCVATSSGNTGSALAAYCAAAGIECVIAIVEGAPLGKLQQMLAYGARLFRIRGFGIDPDVTAGTFQVVEALGTQPGSATQVSSWVYSPKGMSAVQTLGLELGEQGPRPPDHVFCQAGAGGMMLALTRGFAEMVRRGRLPRSPRVECVQPEGNDTIASPLRQGAAEAREVRCTTKISGLQVPNILDGHEALQACRASGGTGHVVSDEEIWATQSRMAREEGIFCEPAGAAALAGALRAAAAGELDPEALVVCLVTGSGFKDPPSVERMLAGTSGSPSPLRGGGGGDEVSSSGSPSPLRGGGGGGGVVDLAEFRRLL